MTAGEGATPTTPGLDVLSMEPCISDAALADILEGRAGPAVLTAAQVHAADCEACRELLVNVGRVRAGELLARTDPGADANTQTGAADDRDPLVGTTIGRFEVIERLGKGGMGIVYAARDDTLKRRIAIKILQRAVPSDRDGGRERLLREARAMATVEHPNVVSVHEVGLHEGRVFIVMDLVDGTDLAAWCRREQRSFAETIRVWLEAGRGLAAVHALGLVHRDFKPQNVLVAQSGRVQVTDFGLVAATEHIDLTPDPEQLQALVGQVRTETGVVLGTPRYMPPEQLAAGKVDFTGDQFAYCVSLWEALTGVHPFGGENAIVRLERVRRGAFEVGPGDRHVPSDVLAVLRRGLAYEPSARYPDMDTLLRALLHARDAGRRRMQIVGGVLVLGAATAIGVFVGGRVDAAQCEPPTTGDFAGVWDAERRAQLEKRVAEADAIGEDAQRVTAAIDAYTERWSAMRREACEATRVRQEVSEDMLDRRMACLSRRRSAVTALVDLLAGDEIADDVSALDLAYRLPPLAACEDLARLDAEPQRPADPHARKRIDLASAELDAATMVGSAGLRTQALERVDAVIELAHAEDWPVLYAEALTIRAQLNAELADDTALADWRRAYVASVAAGPFVGYNAALTGVRVLARRGDASEAAFLLDVAGAYAAQLGGDSGTAELASMRALIARQQGDLLAAETALREAIDRLTANGDQPDELALAWGNLGGVLAGQARVNEALEATDRGIALSAEQFGPQHLFTLQWRTNRAGMALLAYRYEDAASEAEEVVAALRQLDSELDVAAALVVLGRARSSQGGGEQACALIEEGVTTRERALPPGAPQTLSAQYHLAECLIGVDRPRDAEAVARRALEHATQSDGQIFHELETVLAVALIRSARATEAIALLEPRLDDDLPTSTMHDKHRAHGNALRDLGDREGAIASLRKAVALQQPGDNDAHVAASARMELATLLLDAGDPAGATEQVQAAIAFMDAVGDTNSELYRELHAWLERHR